MQVLEALSKNCGDNVHLPIIERNILHELVKIVKKKVIWFLFALVSGYIDIGLTTCWCLLHNLFPLFAFGHFNFLILVLFNFFNSAARLKCERKDFDSHRYMARGFWGAGREISPVLCCVQWTEGTQSDSYYMLSCILPWLPFITHYHKLFAVVSFLCSY